MGKQIIIDGVKYQSYLTLNKYKWTGFDKLFDEYEDRIDQIIYRGRVYVSVEDWGTLRRFFLFNIPKNIPKSDLEEYFMIKNRYKYVRKLLKKLNK